MVQESKAQLCQVTDKAALWTPGYGGALQGDRDYFFNLLRKILHN
jgi:hypothetical protein